MSVILQLEIGPPWTDSELQCFFLHLNQKMIRLSSQAPSGSGDLCPAYCTHEAGTWLHDPLTFCSAMGIWSEGSASILAGDLESGVKGALSAVSLIHIPPGLSPGVAGTWGPSPWLLAGMEKF